MSTYEWDPAKAEANARKHGITFDEAEEAASHPLALEEPDVAHSLGEERLKVVGWSPRGRCSWW